MTATWYEAQHIDGSMNASQKETKLTWLKADTPENTCRVMSNVRCLSEGVDVPAPDAVLFLTPRNSQVDVVQSVGRVMRKGLFRPGIEPLGSTSHLDLPYSTFWNRAKHPQTMPNFPEHAWREIGAIPKNRVRWFLPKKKNPLISQGVVLVGPTGIEPVLPP